MKFLLVLLCGLLGACEAPRPIGAWEPKYPDAGRTDIDALGDDTDDEKATDDDDLAGQTDDDEKAPTPGKDATVKPPMDAGTPAPATGPYGRLPGKYLMRMDSYTEVDATEGSNRLHVQNRVSNLVFVTLRVDEDGNLVGDEKLCDQTYTVTCLQGCNYWNTKLDPVAQKNFVQNVTATRAYTLEDGVLKGGESTMLLGFKADEATSSTKLPTSLSDGSLWKLDGSDPKRVGLRTIIDAELKTSGAFPITAKFACNLVTVQRVTGSFTFSGIETSDKDAIAAAFRPFESTELSGLNTLDAVAGSTSASSTRSFCSIETFSGKSPTKETNAVKFKRADDLSGCPTGAEFEKMFPGSVSPPTFK